jgi:hypothetical protein
MALSMTMRFMESSDEYGDAVGGFVVAAVLVILLVVIYLRQGRNRTLERILAESEFGSPVAFKGTLAVEEYKPGISLRLCKSTKATRILQFKYRWLGMGRQAIFDEVVFDRAAGAIQLKLKGKNRTASFSEFSAIRMREIAGHRGAGSVWHVEVVPRNGRATPFVTSVRADRRAAFEHTVPVAKAAAAIMEVPVQVIVAGNVWTPGWPPKNSIASESR